MAEEKQALTEQLEALKNDKQDALNKLSKNEKSARLKEEAKARLKKMGDELKALSKNSRKARPLT